MSSGASSRVSTDRGVSSVLGVTLLIAVVIAGMTTVVVVGGTALTDTKDQSEIKRAEHSMTLFDSRTAMVALGASEVQSVRLGQDSGNFQVRSDAGQLTLKHTEYDGTNDEILFRKPLGAVVYENGPTTIAYQSGGVWRLDEDGEARMISPPEFSYRRATLTLPIVRVNGSGSASGSVSATVSGREEARRVFPNTSASGASVEVGAPYNNTGDRPYTNPVTNGTVYAYVQSDYYEAWARYFRQRTDGDIKVYDGNRTVRFDLSSLGAPPGQFTVPEPDAGSVRAGGVGSNHPITDFTVSLDVRNNLNNAQFSFWSDEGPNELEIHINPDDNCGGGGFSGPVEFRVYYRNTSTGQQEEWYGTFDNSDDVIDVTCSGGPGDSTFTINFTSSTDDLEYRDVSVGGTPGNKYHFAGLNDPADSPVTIDQHAADSGASYTDGGGDYESVNWTVNHYFSRMPTNFEIQVESGPGSSNRFYESSSTGSLDYAQASGGQYVTYLHITENEVEVDFD